MIRYIVWIDEELCNGCGDCVPACAEEAIRIVGGKARLVSDTLCDGLGACLGHCPRGAITIKARNAEPFDELAVERAAALPSGTQQDHHSPIGAVASAAGTGGSVAMPSAGCPSCRIDVFDGPARRDAIGPGTTSELRHWPVQLRLVPSTSPALRGARLLVAADCVSVACADFHESLLRGRSIVMACPKLDDTRGYVEKLAEMIRHNDFEDITVAHMEVPCCTGILHTVLLARRMAGSDVPVHEVLTGTRGQIMARRQIAVEPACCAASGP
jgi:ferredoxin